jgi:hypothetical protein
MYTVYSKAANVTWKLLITLFCLTDIASSSFFIMQLVASVDESLYQQRLQTSMVEAEEEWGLDDDDGLFFYPEVRLQMIFSCRLIASDVLACMEIYIPDSRVIDSHFCKLAGILRVFGGNGHPAQAQRCRADSCQTKHTGD